MTETTDLRDPAPIAAETSHIEAEVPPPVVEPVVHPETLDPEVLAPESPPEAELAVVEPIPEPEPKVFPYDLDNAVLDHAFRHARTPRAWTDRTVDEETFRHLYDLIKLGPTSANSSPARFVFIRSQDAKDRLRPALTPGNVEVVMAAPVTVIVAFDPAFYDFLPRLNPQTDARSWFAWNDEFSQETAMRNSSIQGGYLILAARMLGLDCWPMSGFDNARVDLLFLDGRGWRSNFLLSLGYGVPPEEPRLPRLGFEEACETI
jgi:3-hydroxypropanoate dehydrogenase